MEELLRALDDSAGVWSFLAARLDRAHIVAPETMLQRILARAPAPRFSYATDLAAPIPEGRTNLFVWDLDRGELARAREANPSCRVFGIIRDVWCDIAARSEIPLQLSRVAGATAVNYAIVCTPRSGSEFLCALLTAAGLGRPREHVREFFIELCRSGYAFDEIMRWTMPRASAGGYFGTKLISHFLWRAIASEPTGEAVPRFLRQNGFRIIVLQRDPAEQAVSGYFAHQTGIWKQRGPSAATRHAEVPYDRAALQERYQMFVAANQRIATFAREFAETLEIRYRALDAAPQATLRRVAAFLGVPDWESLEIDLSRLPHKISRTQNRMQEHLAQFRRQLAGAAPAG